MKQQQGKKKKYHSIMIQLAILFRCQLPRLFRGYEEYFSNKNSIQAIWQSIVKMILIL